MLEARDRVGGRTWSRELANGATVEMGAEFILPGNTEVARAGGRARARALGQGHALRPARAARRHRHRPRRSSRPACAAVDRRARRRSRAGRRARELLDSLPIDRRRPRGDPRPGRDLLARARPTRSPPPTWPGSRTSATSPPPSVAGGNQRLALGARRSGSATRCGWAIRSSAVAWERRRGAGRGPRAGATSDADACVVAVPATVHRPDRVRARAAGGEARRARAGALRPRREALRPARRAGAARRGDERAASATGAGPRPARASEPMPVVSCFAGSPAALERLGGRRPAPGAGSSRWRRCARSSRWSPTAPCSRPGTTTPGSRGAYSISPPPGADGGARRAGRAARVRRRAHRRAPSTA